IREYGRATHPGVTTADVLCERDAEAQPAVEGHREVPRPRTCPIHAAPPDNPPPAAARTPAAWSFAIRANPVRGFEKTGVVCRASARRRGSHAARPRTPAAAALRTRADRFEPRSRPTSLASGSSRRATFSRSDNTT